MTHVVAITSAKGGVGKTTTIINIAAALALFGRNIIAVDADLTTPNMSLQLSIGKVPHTIHQALSGTCKITDAIYTHPSGLRVVPGVVSYGEKHHVLFAKLKETIHDLVGVCEVVLVDSPPGLGVEAEDVISAVDGVVVVTTPDLTSVTDSRKTIKLATDQKKIVLGVVLNRVRGDKYEMDIGNVQSYLETPVIGIVPEDHAVRASQRYGNPVVYSHPDAPSTQVFKKIAMKLIGQ